jgi:type II secretory pathway pseudopilin PulG
MLRAQSGSTIFELIITLAVSSILASVALLGFSAVRSSFEKSESRSQLQADLKVLRNSAIEHGARAFLIVNQTGTSYSAALDYAPYSASPVAERILFSRPLPSGITLSVPSGILVNSKGFTISNDGSITTSTITLSLHSQLFVSATLYPTGVLA